MGTMRGGYPSVPGTVHMERTDRLHFYPPNDPKFRPIDLGRGRVGMGLLPVPHIVSQETKEILVLIHIDRIEAKRGGPH